MSAAPRRRPPRRAFTLIELMVAMALMTILTGSVVFIFIQSREIFTSVDAQVQVYQYTRYAFDQIERDLSNVVRSSNMEFFNDLPPPTGVKGRYDPGEEIPISTGVADGVLYRNGMCLRQPVTYKGQGEKGIEFDFRQDSIYFRTVTTVEGRTTNALIEYALTDTLRERPRLVRRLWYVTGVDNANPVRPMYQINEGKGPLTSDLCLYTVESRFEFFFRDRRRDDAAGQFFSAEEFVNPPDVNGRTPFVEHRDYWGGPDQMIMAYYDQTHDIRQGQLSPDLGVFEPAEKGLFKTERSFTFPMLREGDRMFIGGGGLQPKDYTIKAFVKVDGTPWTSRDLPRDMRIQFEEPIEWPGAMAGQTLKVLYSASWLPPALRMTLRVKDVKSRTLRSVQRVFKILST